MTDAYEVYCQYTAVKLTYDKSNDYDYFKYGGRIRRNKSTFMKRHDRSKYYHLAKSFDMDLEQVVDFLFLSLFYDPTSYISNLKSTANLELWKVFQNYQNDFAGALEKESKTLSQQMQRDDMTALELLSTNNATQPSRLMELVYGRVYTPMLLHSISRCVNVLGTWLENDTAFAPLLDGPLHRFVSLDQRLRKHSDHLTKNELNGIVGSRILQRGR